MTWQPENEIWICAGCDTLYNLPADDSDVAATECCSVVRARDVIAFEQAEAEEESRREPWQGGSSGGDGMGRGEGFYFEVDDD